MRRIFTASALAAAVAVTGCASIISDSNYPVTVNSSPDGAKFQITNLDNGMTVMKGETPATVTLKASDGFFSGAEYAVKFEKDGYEAQDFMIDSKIDGWYFANLLFGGVLGFLVIDPATGAMWKLDESLMVSMSKDEDAENKTVSVLTLDDVPVSLRDKMVRIQ